MQGHQCFVNFSFRFIVASIMDHRHRADSFKASGYSQNVVCIQLFTVIKAKNVVFLLFVQQLFRDWVGL